ncbi:nucleoside recognition domain-containing protein [Oscillospiraceae bacterium PP1C4]
MNYIFGGLILFSFVFAAATGRMEQLSRAAMEQAGSAVALVFSLLGMLCLWSGLMKIAQESKLTDYLSKALSPVTKRLFNNLSPSGEAMSAICMNIVANLIGLGNAATPLGIKAMCEMAKEQRANGTATNNMALFVVINTASLQLIPTTTALIRMQYGSANPLDILPAVWISSAVSVLVGIIMAWMLAPLWRVRV